MSVLGVGSIYVISCLVITVLSIFISKKGFIDSGKIPEIKFILIILGVLSFLLGIALWIQAVLYRKW